MRLLVLAGGLGTRLRAAVADVPKALAPIGDVPFLQLQIAQWFAQGVREFIFLLHHQADQVVAFLKAQRVGQLKNCEVHWLIDPVPLGTGGAIAYAVRMLNLKDDFLITNADTWLGGGIHEMKNSAAPAMAVVNLTDVSRYGRVHFDNDQRVSAFREKNSEIAEGWVNAGLCHMNADAFQGWDGQPFSLEHDFFSTLVQNRRLTAVPLQIDFIDIGIPADYHRFCQWVATDRQNLLCN